MFLWKAAQRDRPFSILTGIFWYFTSQDQKIPEKYSAVGQTYRLLYWVNWLTIFSPHKRKVCVWRQECERVRSSQQCWKQLGRLMSLQSLCTTLNDERCIKQLSFPQLLNLDSYHSVGKQNNRTGHLLLSTSMTDFPAEVAIFFCLFYICIAPLEFLPWEIRLLSSGKASCDSHTTQPKVHAGCFSVFIVHQTLTGLQDV